ncbi:MAG: TolC family protein, partial [Planctomycetes bacterium]|nr:TolC family protein [Planctomycetota bacterium]
MSRNVIHSQVLLATGLLLFATGCADVREARRAQEEAHAPPGQRTPSADELGLVPGSTLTLEQALRIALDDNPAIALARSRVDAAIAQARQVDAAYWPQITASADARIQQSGGGSSTAGGGKDDVTRSYAGSIGFSQLLFDFGRTNAQSRAAAEAVGAASADLEAATNDTAFNLEQAFFDVLKQRELIGVGEETVRQFEKRLEQVQGFVEVGTRQRYDLTKAEVDLGNARLTLVKARTGFAVAQAVLDNALGLAEVPKYVVAKPTSSDAWSLSFDDSARMAFDTQPRIAAQKLREEGASEQVNAAVADLYPQLSLQGSYSVSGVRSSPVAWSWFLGPLANWLVFGGWSKTGALREAVANLAQARATRAQLEQ